MRKVPYKHKNKISTAIIDGFLVSPNIAIGKVETIDVEFRNNNHHPVFISVSTVDKGLHRV
jgi:hypothetical protein